MKRTTFLFVCVVLCLLLCSQPLASRASAADMVSEANDFYYGDPICLHTCMVCGMCTSEDLLACNSYYGERVSQCNCKMPLPVIQSAGVENAWIVDSNTWCGDVTARVESFDLDSVNTELVFASEYFQSIFSSVGSMDVEALYDISIYNENGHAYAINQGGGAEEYVTLTVPVSAEIVAIDAIGELELYHVNRHGVANEVAFTVDADNSTLTFTGTSFGPYALIQKPAMYGRNLLKDMPNAASLLYAYDRVAENVEMGRSDVMLNNGKCTISVEELELVMDLFYRDNGGAFMLDNPWSYSYFGGAVGSVTVYYRMPDDVAGALEAFDAQAQKVLSGITPSMSEFEKVLYIHDELAKMVEYVDTPNAHNAYGALVEGKAVCEGYAEAFQYLLQKAGIQSFAAIGSSINPGTGRGEPHEWNYVRIDGKYYHVDLTWNDQGEEQFHAYFGVTDAMIQEDHDIETVSYALPICDSTDAFYFEGKPENLYTYNTASVARILEDNDYRVHVYIPGDVSDFMTWFNDSILDIAQEAGIEGAFSYGYSYLGREIILSFTEPDDGYNISGTISSIDAGVQTVKVELYQGDELQDAAELSGDFVSFNFANVKDGTYTLRITKQGHHAQEITVFVNGADVVQNVALDLSGDINGDGKLNNKDASRLFQYLSGWDVEVNEALLDINGDGKVNNKDASRLFQYLSGWDVEIF